MVTTSRCSVISLTVWVLGTSTSMPDCRMGAVIMKMMRRTRTTSMNGTMLMSERELCVDLVSCGMVSRLVIRELQIVREKKRIWRIMERVDSFLISAVGFLVSVGRTQTTGTKAKNRVVVESHILSKCFFNLRGEFVGESVQALSQFANILEKIVVSDEGGDRREEARCGGDKCFGDAGSNGAEAGGTGSAEAREGVNDAPNRTKKTDERSDASCGSQPRHALFDTT